MPTFVPPMSLTTAHSLWLAPLCLLLGVAYAWWLYRRGDDRFAWGPRLALLLGVLRALVVSALAFFLLEPMVRTMVREVRRPVIVIAHDGSRSLTLAGDTAALKSTYEDALADLADRLGEAYTVRTFTYGERVREGLDHAQDDGLTDIGGLFREVRDRFGGPDLGAVIIDGDGIQNRGRDPVEEGLGLAVPIYPVALGDTTVRPDLAVKAVEHNRHTYLGNEFPLLVRLKAAHLQGTRSEVVVEQDGKVLQRRPFTITSDPWYQEVPLVLQADKAGLQRYRVSVAHIDADAAPENDREDVFIEVLDDRRNVLVVAAAPHPDVAAIRLALSKLEGYTTSLALPTALPGDLTDVDLVVLHGAPTATVPLRAFLDRCQRADMPLLVAVTSTTDLNWLGTSGSGVSVTGVRPGSTEASAYVQEDFALFTLDKDEARALADLPPLETPFGEFLADRGADVLLKQRIGMVRTDRPLLALRRDGAARKATIVGEGLWRWRSADRWMHGSTDHFDGLVHSIVQFLAVHTDRNRFRLKADDLFSEDEPVRIEAELYNASYEAVNGPEATLLVKDEQGEELAYVFTPSGNGYRLEVQGLAPGRYTGSASVQLGDERFTAQVSFTVQELQLEQRNTVADHRLWDDLAVRSGGRTVHPDGLASLDTLLAERPEIGDRSYEHATFSDLIGLPWIFALLLALLTLEWALRRRAGGY